MSKFWAIKRKGKYYNSSLRNPDSKEIIEINWVDELDKARFFSTKEQAKEILSNYSKKTKVVCVKLVEV